MNNHFKMPDKKTISGIAILGCSLGGATISFLRAYQKRSIADAIAGACIWLILTPLIAWWWQKRLNQKPEDVRSSSRLYWTILSSLIAGLVILAGVIYAHHSLHSVIAILLWLILAPFLAYWLFRRRRESLDGRV